MVLGTEWRRGHEAISDQREGAEHSLQHNVGLSHSWRRNVDGSIIRKSLKKMLEVLVAQYPVSDVWALPGVRAGAEQLQPRSQAIGGVLQEQQWVIEHR